MKRLRCAYRPCRRPFEPKVHNGRFCSPLCKWRANYRRRREVRLRFPGYGHDPRLALDILLDGHAHRSEDCRCGAPLRFAVGLGGTTLAACDRCGDLSFVRPRLPRDGRRYYRPRDWAA